MQEYAHRDIILRTVAYLEDRRAMLKYYRGRAVCLRLILIVGSLTVFHISSRELDNLKHTVLIKKKKVFILIGIYLLEIMINPYLEILIPFDIVQALLSKKIEHVLTVAEQIQNIIMHSQFLELFGDIISIHLPHEVYT